MSDHLNRKDGATAGRAATIQLTAKKGSRLVPLLLLALALIVFISDHIQNISGSELGSVLGSQLPIAEKIAATAKSLTVSFFQAFSTSFWSVLKGTLATIGVLSLYALVPGIAGLIYRRSFWRYFLAGFVVLYIVGSLLSPKATGVSGLVHNPRAEPTAPAAPKAKPLAKAADPNIAASASAAPSSRLATFNAPEIGSQLPAATPAPATASAPVVEPPPPETAVSKTAPAKKQSDPGPATQGMERFVFFIVSQLVLVLLAFRLHRHTSSVGVMRPHFYNALVAVVLGAIAYACYARIGPDRMWNAFLPGDFYRWEFLLLMLPADYLLLRRRLVWPSLRPKNIVVCLDGTNNTPGQQEFGRISQTNVLKLFDMLKQDRRPGAKLTGLVPERGQFDATLTKRYGTKQIAFYYSGVGNAIENSPILDALGLATGLGADSIVDRAYLDVMRVYRPGDRIYLFGFSRGAAIARLLARTIDQQGAPRRIWSLRLFGRHWPLWKSERKQHDVPIAVLGCWDTVGAFGVAKTIAGIDFGKLNGFKDLSIPDNVQQAYHLVALDEQRDSSAPTLMDPDPLTPERIVEVWFSGDHSNVGGSWATDKLSDVTLDFMLSRVSSGYITDATGEPGNEDWGLYLSGVNARAYQGELSHDIVALDPDPLGQLRQVTSLLYTYTPRKLPLHAVISEAVIERMMRSEPAYAPESLFNLNDEIDKKRDAIDEKVARMEETGSLTGEERTAILAAKEKMQLTRWPAYWESLTITTPPPQARLNNKLTEAAA